MGGLDLLSFDILDLDKKGRVIPGVKQFMNFYEKTDIGKKEAEFLGNIDKAFDKTVSSYNEKNIGKYAMFGGPLGIFTKMYGDLFRKKPDEYEDGGYVDETGPAIVHKDEFIINKESADKLGENLLASLNDDKSEKKYNLKPLLDMIGSGESDNVGGYTAMFPSESYPEILDMTINELIEFQKEKLKDGRASVAVGRYQFLYPEDYAAAAGLPLTTKFTPENQDKMVIAYLKKNRKLNEFLEGEITNEQFSEELAEEFGTFKSASGFVLPGNSGSINFQMMLPVLNEIKTQKIEPTTTKERSLTSKLLGVLDAITRDKFDFDNLGRGVSPDRSDSNQDYSMSLAQRDDGGMTNEIEIREAIIQSTNDKGDGTGSIGTPPFDVADTGTPTILPTLCPFESAAIKRNTSNNAFV